MSDSSLRAHAVAIWQAAVDAVQPGPMIQAALGDPAIRQALDAARRILVVGAGKAGATMSAAVEEALADRLDRAEGIVNVPESAVRPLLAIRLHAARPDATNEPTEAGVAGAEEMLGLLSHGGPEDVALCLLSGGGSALLPAPVEGVTLADKQEVTRLLHACGADISEMNCVRKHLSRIKGGRLAEAFSGRALFGLVLSDVIGDRLDVIASGPTAADPTDFREALAILGSYELLDRVPPAVLRHLRRGATGDIPDTPKELPQSIDNRIIGSNGIALAAACREAERLGYEVPCTGTVLSGDTRRAAESMTALARMAATQGFQPPLCLVSGGETTVTLQPGHGRGGRNQEFVLAALVHLGARGMDGLTILSGGTDGEDGPTDAAGAVADADTLARAEALGLSPDDFLRRHDSYTFFDAVGGLLRTGLTGTNVMDVRVLLVSGTAHHSR